MHHGWRLVHPDHDPGRQDLLFVGMRRHLDLPSRVYPGLGLGTSRRLRHVMNGRAARGSISDGCGMQVTRRLNGAMACAVAICASAASMALAEGPRVPSDNPSADAGTGWNVLSIPAAGFLMSQNVFSMEYQLLPDGYAYVRDPTDLGRTITFWA